MAGSSRVSSLGEELCKVQVIKTLGLADDAGARNLLERIASQVQPIMRKRRWRVLVLSEFSPRNPSLLGLNVNQGQEIKIRLRRPGRDWNFYPYESLLGTMLHELTHNVHGPHDANFYRLLDEITRECEELMAKGITGTGQGFDLPGKRLGGVSRNAFAPNIRRAAAEAAEKRQRLGTLMSSGPQKLGGDVGMRHLLTPTQAAAMAAERRLRDDLWCAAPDTVGEAGFQRARDREDTVSTGPGTSQANPIELDKMGQELVQRAVKGGEADPPLGWACSLCTLVNPELAVVCAGCDTFRETDKTGWDCKFCTLKNPKHVDRCTACNEWRYAVATCL